MYWSVGNSVGRYPVLRGLNSAIVFLHSNTSGRFPESLWCVGLGQHRSPYTAVESGPVLLVCAFALSFSALCTLLACWSLHDL